LHVAAFLDEAFSSHVAFQRKIHAKNKLLKHLAVEKLNRLNYLKYEVGW